MNNFYKKYRIVFNLVVFAAFISVFIYFLAYPLIKKIETNSKEILKRNIDAEINNSKITKLSEMRKQHDDIESSKNSMDVILERKNEVDFIKKLEFLADETGSNIELKIIEDYNQLVKKNKKKSKDEKDIVSNLPTDNYIYIEILLKGRYSGFLNFINKLENLEKYANIISYNLNLTTEQEKSRENVDVFSASNVPRENIISEKEILKSTIGLIVYIKD